MASDNQPIIRKKIVKGHAAHHGGAWKVAYADFVTAMMAFFLVMWIIGLDSATRRAIEGYFQDPAGFNRTSRGDSGPLIGGKKLSPGNPQRAQRTAVSEEQQIAEQNKLHEVKKSIERELRQSRAFKDLAKQVEIKMDKDGLRIELLEGPKPVFFKLGSAIPEPKTVELLQFIASKIGALPNHISVEGHTDRRAFKGANGMTNWELSTDRANEARHIMDTNGLHPGQVADVRGYADRVLRVPEDPFHYSNRRVSILVLFEAIQGKVNLTQGIKDDLKDGLKPVSPDIKHKQPENPKMMHSARAPEELP